MDIDVDLNDVINDLLDQYKALLLENLILKKALSSVDVSDISHTSPPYTQPVQADTA